jgi:hypothetical protein
MRIKILGTLQWLHDADAPSLQKCLKNLIVCCLLASPLDSLCLAVQFEHTCGALWLLQTHCPLHFYCEHLQQQNSIAVHIAMGGHFVAQSIL